jgi:hypothetical protein
MASTCGVECGTTTAAVEFDPIQGGEPEFNLPHDSVPKPEDRRRPTEELPLERIAIRPDHREVATHIDREAEALFLIRLRGSKRADMHGRRGEGGGRGAHGEGERGEADAAEGIVTCPPKTDPSAMRVPTGPGWALETLDETDTTHP